MLFPVLASGGKYLDPAGAASRGIGISGTPNWRRRGSNLIKPSSAQAPPTGNRALNLVPLHRSVERIKMAGDRPWLFEHNWDLNDALQGMAKMAADTRATASRFTRILCLLALVAQVG
jgi:hypothetical protein